MAHPTARNKQEELQQLVDERTTDDDLVVEFRRFVGWFAVYPEPRHFGDSGIFLGKNVTEAKQAIRFYWTL